MNDEQKLLFFSLLEVTIGQMIILLPCSAKLNRLILSPVLSFRYKLSDEPHLDGQDQNAAGEKVCTLFISPILHVLTCFNSGQTVV